MHENFDHNSLQWFQELIAARLGLFFDESKEELLHNILTERAKQTSAATHFAYLQQLEALGAEGREWRVLAQRLTVGETYFFRQPGHFQALGEIVLPARLQARAAQKQISLVSVGCSSGEEAYSLAILLQEAQPMPEGWTVEIIGCDMNPAALEKARLAHYSSWSMRALPAYLCHRYFRRDKNTFVLQDTIRQQVLFQELNLMTDKPGFWRAGRFDVIFCRNVLMYFTPESTKKALQRFEFALAPGGYLFLGHAETLHRTSQAFQVCSSHGSFYYQRHMGQKKTTLTPPPASQPVSSPSNSRPGFRRAGAGSVPHQPATVDYGDMIAHPSPPCLATLQESVVDSHARIEQIAAILQQKQTSAETRPGSEGRPSSPSLSLAYVSPEFAEVWTLLRQERFDQALACLDQAGQRLQLLEPESLFLRAAMLFNTGQVTAARRCCEDLLSAHDLHGHVHYLMALCEEQSGQYRSAMKRAKTAIYLAPESAMPYLLLGRLARRLGELSEARKAFQEAIRLLPQEEAPVLLLFGGGFSQEALSQLCEARLQMIGEHS